MGAGASANAATPFASVEAALAAGKTQDEVDAWMTTQGEKRKGLSQLLVSFGFKKKIDLILALLSNSFC